MRQAEEIAKGEGITDQKDLELLRIAILYHDIGFLYLYKGHEEAACEIARDELGAYGVTPDDLEIICGLIMATKIPQSPANKLEEIICDADLDYLGRDDFFPIAHKLYQEMKFYGYVQDELEWNRIQVKFLGQHRYFTRTNQLRRAAKKAEHLEHLQQQLATRES